MSTVMMERSAMGMRGMGAMGMGGRPSMMAPTDVAVVRRCSFEMEKVNGGMKITCPCADTAGCTTVQSLCGMLSGGMCTCCVMMNGMTVGCCNLMMGMCKCEMTDKGVSMTCTSGDAACASMIQGCCD